MIDRCFSLFQSAMWTATHASFPSLFLWKQQESCAKSFYQVLYSCKNIGICNFIHTAQLQSVKKLTWPVLSTANCSVFTPQWRVTGNKCTTESLVTPLTGPKPLKALLNLTTLLITITGAFRTTPVCWVFESTDAAQCDDWRGRLMWLAAATNMPSSVPSPPTLGQPFALLSYPASGLLLFTRQTLFTQWGLAVCLQRISRVSWPPTTSDSAQCDSAGLSDEAGQPFVHLYLMYKK